MINDFSETCGNFFEFRDFNRANLIIHTPILKFILYKNLKLSIIQAGATIQNTKVENVHNFVLINFLCVHNFDATLRIHFQKSKSKSKWLDFTIILMK